MFVQSLLSYGMQKSLGLLIFLALLTLGLQISAQEPDRKATKPDAVTSTVSAASDAQKAPLPLEELRRFTLIFDHIRRSYVEPVSDQVLLNNAIKGMLQQLDPHSNYLDSPHYSALQENTTGEFEGVGLEIGRENDYIKVITPIDDSPAASAGIEAGDLIIRLDNESIRGFSLSETTKKIRGPKGSSVVFTILRKGVEKPINITVIRDTIKTRSVRSRVIDKDYGYVRISQFQSNTGKDFVDALGALREQSPQLKGIALDLRNNPGGILQASVEVADAVLNEGVVVYTEGRLADSNQSFRASAGDVTDGLPLVVLINGGSASAAEIVAGALQDHNRAIILGTTSFGKGSVQTILPVGQDKGIKLTTARYYTPNGRSIQAHGIVPDVEIKRATITELEETLRFKEANLSGHLSNNTTTVEKPKASEPNHSTASQLKDNQLFEAMNMLKGLAIYRQGERAQKEYQ